VDGTTALGSGVVIDPRQMNEADLRVPLREIIVGGSHSKLML
jgi:hypothetical protein